MAILFTRKWICNLSNFKFLFIQVNKKKSSLSSDPPNGDNALGSNPYLDLGMDSYGFPNRSNGGIPPDGFTWFSIEDGDILPPPSHILNRRPKLRIPKTTESFPLDVTPINHCPRHSKSKSRLELNSSKRKRQVRFSNSPVAREDLEVVEYTTDEF